MTSELAKEILPIIQAFAEGKKIQYRNYYDEWMDIKENEGLSFICLPSDYRIKPQSKYRPFESQEECRNEMHKHPDFGWVKMKHNGIYSNISMMKSSCGEETIMVANSSYNLAHAFKFFTFADGAPFGMVEE